MKPASVTRRNFLAGTSAAFAAAPWLRALPPGGSPAAQFLNPPAEARPSTYWVWLNGHTDAAQMTRELEALEKNGFGTAYILEIGAREKEVPAGSAWFSPESVKAIGHAAREAKRLGLEIGFTNASSWNSGGPWITPEYASKGLYISRLDVEGPRRFTGSLPFPALPAGVPAKPDGSPEFYSEVAVLAVPEKERLESFDFLFDLDPGAPLIHRSDGERDIYFVRNTRGEWAEADCEFRVSGKAPVLCDPVSGEELEVAAYESREKRTSVLLSLPPHGGMIVVFEHESAAVPLRVLRNGERVPANILRRAAGRTRLLCFEPGEYVVEEAKGKRSRTQVAPLPAPVSLDGEWTVGFAPGLGAPARKIYPRLASWTEDSDPGIRYFSGIATYRKTISVPSALRGKNMRLFLDLGRVEVIARVRLNGKDLGVCWTAPFRLDITGAVRAGANELEIEVANMWSNRLTGDAQPGAKKYAKTNIAWKPDTPLLASGLLGPVRLVSAAEQEIRLA